MTEEWRPVKEYEGIYEISSHGRARSLDRNMTTSNSIRFYHGRILAPRIGKKDGYVSYCLSKGGVAVTHGASSLVLEAFVGPRRAGMDACHNDGNRLNNRVPNLRWDTRTGNMTDSKLHGTRAYGSRHGMSKLNPEAIATIRLMAKEGKMYKEICAVVGTSVSNIGHVVKGKTWVGQ